MHHQHQDGIKTLEILRDHPELYTKIEENTKKLAEAYKVRAKKQGINIHVNQIGSLMSAFFTGENVKDYTGATSSDTKAYADYFNYMCVIISIYCISIFYYPTKDTIL